MSSLFIPTSSIKFNKMEFAFPLDAKLHSINEDLTIFAYLIVLDELINYSTSYEIHIIRLNMKIKHKISNELSFKPNTMKFMTIKNKTEPKIQSSLIIGYDNGKIDIMDINCNIFFTQNICHTSIKSISIHLENCFYSYYPSIILNCESFLLFITADEIYKIYNNNNIDSLLLLSSKKIILSSTPKEIIDIISIPPIHLMRHGIKLPIINPQPPLNLYSSNQLFLIIIGSLPCITYVQIDNQSKGFGVNEIKQSANKLVKSALNLVSKSISFNVFNSFWSTNTNTNTNQNENTTDYNININQESTRYKIQCIFNDENRKINQIILSPLRRYAAIIDNYGRISVLDCKTFGIIRMFKGCRSAQCGWIQLSLNNNKSQKQPWSMNNILLLVIYIAPRGILEIYHLNIKHRLGTLLFNPNGLLLYHLLSYPSHLLFCDYCQADNAVMYELKITVNDENDICITPIIFIHPLDNVLTVNEKIESNDDSCTDMDDDVQLPSGNSLNQTNFEQTFMKYIENWKFYMADIPNALMECLQMFNDKNECELMLNKYWNLLISIQIKQHTEIATFCDFLLHIMHQIISKYSQNNPQRRLWIFRAGNIASYKLICNAYLTHLLQDKITLTLCEWYEFWISHYKIEKNNDGNNEKKCQIFSTFLFDVITLESEEKEEKIKMEYEGHEIPCIVMKKMSLPANVLSLYLELFLFWFVTQQSHKWSNNTSGYDWKYLFDYSSLNIWLNAGRLSRYDDINIDWTHERFDELLTNPLNINEQQYVLTLQYFMNFGGQFLGLLRDYIQNTTQLSHAFLLCRVCDNINNETNNEWLIACSRILKMKLFSFLFDYNHHSLQYMAGGLNISQTYYLISMKEILSHYYRSGYSINDIEKDLPISRLLAKYILKKVDINGEKKEKDIKQELRHEIFIETLLFLFEVIDFILKHKNYEYDGVVQYILSSEKEKEKINALDIDIDFIDEVIKNIYYMIRIVSKHINMEWLIFYCLFDIYEQVVTEELVKQQLILLHKFQISCGKILQYYGGNMNIQLEVIILNGQLWYYVLSSLLNELNFDINIVTTAVEWIKFVLDIIDSFIILQQENKNNLLEYKNEEKEENKNEIDHELLSNDKKKEIGQGYKREKAYLYEDTSELASWPPIQTAVSFIYNQYLQPATLLFFTSPSVQYTNHLKAMLNLYLQILRLYFVANRAKISVCTAADNKNNKKNKNIYLCDTFPDFIEFNCNLFTFELFESYTNSTRGRRGIKISYDGIKTKKFEAIMIIAKKWIAGALDLASSWNLDVHKVRRCIIIELCNNYKDSVALQLIGDDLEYNKINDKYDTNNKHLLAQSLLHIVKKRICFYINQLLHSPKYQHILAGIPAHCFQELLHYNNNKMSISNKDKKQIKQNPNKILKMNLTLTLAINSLLKQDDFYEKNSKQEINNLLQIINLLMSTK